MIGAIHESPHPVLAVPHSFALSQGGARHRNEAAPVFSNSNWFKRFMIILNFLFCFSNHFFVFYSFALSPGGARHRNAAAPGAY
jgi:hypothetical protein